MDTSNPDYSPWQLLPAPEPRTVSPPDGQFYHSVAKHLIRDTVRLMNSGLSIDLDKVEELEAVLDEQLATVATELASNPYIDTYLQQAHAAQIEAYIADRKSKCRDVSYYLKPFKHSDMHHRSYFMHLFAQQQSISEPSDLLPTGIPKWPANTVRKLAKQFPVLSRLLDGTLANHPLLDVSMRLLAQHKADMYNSKFLAQIESPDVPYPEFNPASSLQKRELFDMLGIESESTSKTTGEPSFNRDEIERINRETTDEHIKHLTQCFIDHSFAAIVRNNFIEAFYKYTVDGKLYGNYKLLGAKSGRYTSNNP
jgi:phosphoribosylformylglycinamidine (FGAM) synthase PurS component